MRVIGLKSKSLTRQVHSSQITHKVEFVLDPIVAFPVASHKIFKGHVSLFACKLRKNGRPNSQVSF